MSHSVWSKVSDGPLPDGLLPCKFCNGYCMYAEYLDFDWDGKPLVFRVGSLCDASESWDKDDARTRFDEPDNVVEEWNWMNSV